MAPGARMGPLRGGGIAQVNHECTLYIPRSEALHNGSAVSRCWEDEAGRLFVEGGMGAEYGNQVNFCPVCGFRAPVQIGG